jgi:hypothetical protein
MYEEWRTNQSMESPASWQARVAHFSRKWLSFSVCVVTVVPIYIIYVRLISWSIDDGIPLLTLKALGALFCVAIVGACCEPIADVFWILLCRYGLHISREELLQLVGGQRMEGLVATVFRRAYSDPEA